MTDAPRTDWRLREADDADAEGLIELIGKVFEQYEGCVLDLDDEMPDLRNMRSAWRAKQGQAWVVEDEQGLLGCVATEPSRMVGAWS